MSLYPGTDWNVIRTTLLAIIQGMLAPDGVIGSWAGQVQGYTDPTIRAKVTLEIQNVQSIGWDETRLDFDATRPQGQEYVEYVYGLRSFILHMRAESLEQTNGKIALTYIERIRNSFNRSSTVELLSPISCAMFKDGQTQDLSMVVDGRWESVAVLDLSFRATVRQDDSANPYGYIATVGLTGTYG